MGEAGAELNPPLSRAGFFPMTAPAIFDRALLRRRKATALAGHAFPDFLHRLAAEEIAFRLGTMTRTFGRTAVFGAAVAPVREVLAGSRIGEPILADGVEVPGLDLVADLEMPPFAAESLDAVVICLGLEDVNDLPGALTQFRRALKPDGLFLAVMLGGETLGELRQSWLAAETEITGGVTPRVAPFADMRDLGSLLQRAGLALPVADVDRHVARYPDALALMRELKAMGLANPLTQRARTPVTPALLARAAAEYHARFADTDGRVRATFELVTLTAWAPSDTQQKPLRPGSAKARLAEALGTEERKLRR
ncbi:MAG: methyltransferase domain-containing protein [Parvibaculaceae bacterium]